MLLKSSYWEIRSYLGNGALRVQSDETANEKIFAEFVALIIRCKMYTLLKDEMERLDKKPNFMTVPAAIRKQANELADMLKN